MTFDKIAVLSDIHGNRWALEAVIEDIEKRAITTVFNLGDSFYGPLDPAGTAKILTRLNPLSVRGNEDRIIIADAQSSPTLDYVRECLAAEHMEYLRSLDVTKTVEGEMLLFHGTPDDDAVYLIHDVGANGMYQRTAGGIQQLLVGRSEKIFLCGHDHLPNSLQLVDDRLVVNPGSVGLPAYTDDAPHRHYVENGNPRANYCIIEKTRSGWSVEHIGIAYDHDAAGSAAGKNHRDDWAFWLRTGHAR